MTFQGTAKKRSCSTCGGYKISFCSSSNKSRSLLKDLTAASQWLLPTILPPPLLCLPPLVSVWSSFAHRYVITSPLLNRSGASARSFPLGSNMRGWQLQGKTAQTGGRRNLERIPTLKLKDGAHLRKLMQTPPPTLPACQRKNKTKTNQEKIFGLSAL